MATPVKITLDKEREFLLNLNALKKFEESSGINILSLLKSFDPTKLTTDNLITLLWAGLSEKDSSITKEQVGELVGIENIFEIMNALSEALQKNLPQTLKDKVEGVKNDFLKKPVQTSS